jgi:hypothetical protein
VQRPLRERFPRLRLAREHFLIPAGVAYCNTGTLGASPVEVVDR